MYSYPVYKFLTFKAGNFPFSIKHNAEELSSLMSECQSLDAAIKTTPLKPNFLQQIQNSLNKKSIFSTAAIEGNPFSEKEVAQLVGGTKNSASGVAEQEIVNLKKAYILLNKAASPQQGFILSEKNIIKVHKIITHNIEEAGPGRYRNFSVKVGDIAHGGVYTPPKILKDIQNLMRRFVAWFNTPQVMALGPFLRAAILHYHFAIIHPFADGNGRTARFLEAQLLHAEGFKYIPLMLSSYYYKHIDAYYQVLSDTRKNKTHDISPFLIFVINGMVAVLKEMGETIQKLLRGVMLKSYIQQLLQEKAITQRQYDLLELLLLQKTGMFMVKDLLQNAPFSLLYRQKSPLTARRDVEKLVGLKLLSKKDGFAINWSVLY